MTHEGSSLEYERTTIILRVKLFHMHAEVREIASSCDFVNASRASRTSSNTTMRMGLLDGHQQNLLRKSGACSTYDHAANIEERRN
eukprot:5064015-Amphidinium_carterae.1